MNKRTLQYMVVGGALLFCVIPTHMPQQTHATIATMALLQPGTTQSTISGAVAPDSSMNITVFADLNRARWGQALLVALGNPNPSQEMIGLTIEWSLSEDHGTDALSRNNPWNTTMCGYNMVGAINSDGACGVAHYATMDDGIAATVATLRQSNFTEVRQALLGSDVGAAREAIWRSPWAASHYGYGSSWTRLS